MKTAEDMQTMFPLDKFELANPEWHSWHRPSYDEMVAKMGEVLHEQTEEDYSGNSLFLLRRGDQFGILTFGWGSCSGCDALEAADSPKELADLFNQLEGSIRWGTAAETASYLQTHDWEGDFLDADLYKPFIAATLPMLSPLLPTP